MFKHVYLNKNNIRLKHKVCTHKIFCLKAKCTVFKSFEEQQAKERTTNVTTSNRKARSKKYDHGTQLMNDPHTFDKYDY